MRIGNRVVSIRKVTDPTSEETVEQIFASVTQKMDSLLRDRDSEIRQLLARIIRAVARDTVNDILENEAEIAEKAAAYARRIFAGDFDWTTLPDGSKVPEVKE